MKIRNFKKLSSVKNPHGIQSFRLYDTEYAQIMHLFLKMGEGLKPHITPVDVVFYILEGEPVVLIGEERVQVKQDDIIESPKDIVHSIYNETEKDVRVLVMKLPRPSKATKILS